MHTPWPVLLHSAALSRGLCSSSGSHILLPSLALPPPCSLRFSTFRPWLPFFSLSHSVCLSVSLSLSHSLSLTHTHMRACSCRPGSKPPKLATCRCLGGGAPSRLRHHLPQSTCCPPQLSPNPPAHCTVGGVITHLEANTSLRPALLCPYNK